MTRAARFRDAMSVLASAVYVVTGHDQKGRPRGFTATAVVPHRGDPPSIVVSIDESTLSHDVIVGGERFGVSILGSAQEETAQLFATKRPDKFQQVGWDAGATGVPLLEDCIANAVCRVESTLPHGDHTLVVGVIEEAVVHHKDAPLVHWDRRFHAGAPAHTAGGALSKQRRTTVTTTKPDLYDLAARTRELLPAIRERAQAAEETRMVPKETIDELRAAGVFRLYQPARYGGLESDWGAQIELSRIVGAACGSTSWLVAVLTTHSAMVGRLDEGAQDDVWGNDQDALIATGSARMEGKAVPVDGGYLLDGVWRFASGVDHSEWTMVAGPVQGVEAEGVASLRQCLVPASEYEVVDDWHVAGLRGTGSKQVVIREPVFVPAHRTLGFLEMLGPRPPGADVNDGYVYRMELGPYFGTILLGPVLGMAEGALDAYLDITAVKTGVVRGNRVAESETVQLRLAESSAQINAARLVTDRMVAMLHEQGAADVPLTPRLRVESMRDRAYVTMSCVDAVHRLVRQMGATGLTDTNPVQRQFRDISAAQGQIGLNWDRNGGTYGKWALGLATGDRAIDGDVATSQEDAASSIG